MGCCGMAPSPVSWYEFACFLEYADVYTAWFNSRKALGSQRKNGLIAVSNCSDEAMARQSG